MRATTSAAMRCAAMRFSSESSGVRRTSKAPACAEPPAATRRAVSARAAARSYAVRGRARLAVSPAAALASKCPAAAGASTSATRSSGSCASVPMSIPANVTESASFFSRLPPHAGQIAPVMKRATRFFISGLCVVANVCST